jgi:predicted RNase H-like HicB family nuclease
MHYAIVVEEGATSFGAHVPDLPGCIAVARTRAEVMEMIRKAVESHLDIMRKEGLPIPEPT